MKEVSEWELKVWEKCVMLVYFFGCDDVRLRREKLFELVMRKVVLFEFVLICLWVVRLKLVMLWD